jgi:hypothetical protein
MDITGNLLTRDELKRINRERYPELASLIDEYRAVFGDVRVLSIAPAPQNTPVETISPEKDLTASGKSALDLKKMTPKQRHFAQRERLLQDMIASGYIKLGA